MHGCLTKVESDGCAGRQLSQETRSSQAASEAGEPSGKVKDPEQSRNAGGRSADKAAEPEVATGHAELAADMAKSTDIAAALNEEPSTPEEPGRITADSRPSCPGASEQAQGRASGSTKTPSEDRVSFAYHVHILHCQWLTAAHSLHQPDYIVIYSLGGILGNSLVFATLGISHKAL